MPIANPLVDVVTIAVFLSLVTVAAYFTGRYLAAVFSGTVQWNPMVRLENTLFHLIGIPPEEEDSWKGYARDLLIFNAIGFGILFLILILQGLLPLNPQQVPGFSLEKALNIAISFTTNTNWQVYGGETAASYLTQMIGLSVQNFLSAATGLCIAAVVMRGLIRNKTDRIGNFWVDVTRAVLYVLIPLAFIVAVVLLSQGVIQNLDPVVTISGYGGAGTQSIAMGPVASQEAIKMLGTNGGGFYNANSAHPYENPTAFTNFFEIFLILLIPASLPFMFGFLSSNRKQGIAIYVTMMVLFIAAAGMLYSAELAGNPSLASQGVSGVSMEGKEVRFGLAGTVLFSTSTTAVANGAVNTMHDSLTPFGGLVPMVLILLGEVVFGGIGSGFATMIAFVIVAVFIAGLMIGRTPEYLAKKIEIFEMKMAIVTILVPSILVLVFTGIALVVSGGLAGIFNPGPHGLSEVVYAFASMANNNGSAFAGLDAASPFYALAGALVMVVGRFVPAIAMLALAGSLAKKKTIPSGPGTLPTASPSFVLWLIAVILIIGALTFFPFFAMGPVAEHLSLVGGI
ncbi:MAG: potassium-transporting ATPase subunit KdpA [Methanoregulaceae archaeon]|jgi:K+-transporting ATPase ATPase A chain|nr:potassium-transporting ATPase subunit KdpA [Methanoregulaceae archaeon]